MSQSPFSIELNDEKCAIGLRTAVNILEKWGATPRQIENVLRVSRRKRLGIPSCVTEPVAVDAATT